MKGFIIKKKWAELIFQGQKKWEIRGCNCKIRGFVGIVSEGKWIGEIEIVDCLPLNLNNYLKNKKNHQVLDAKDLPYKSTFAWVIGRTKLYKKPKKYIHKNGCVIWVNL